MGISRHLTGLVVESPKTREWIFMESDMADYRLLWKIKLGERHTPTGKTRHYLGGAEAPTPVELRIIRYPDDPGYYLFYCDGEGVEFTDTYHDTVDEAKAQAEWEFNVKPEEWERCA
jgi:hypothetical protein